MGRPEELRAEARTKLVERWGLVFGLPLMILGLACMIPPWLPELRGNRPLSLGFFGFATSLAAIAALQGFAGRLLLRPRLGALRARAGAALLLGLGWVLLHRMAWSLVWAYGTGRLDRMLAVWTHRPDLGFLAWLWAAGSGYAFVQLSVTAWRLRRLG